MQRRAERAVKSSSMELELGARAYPLASCTSMQIFLLAFTFMFTFMFTHIDYLTHVDRDVFTYTYIHLVDRETECLLGFDS
jgi:hypothetical protein